MTRLKILQGDCIDEMDFMNSETVQCCVTSPPYFGLRDYGVDGQIGLEQTPEEYVRKMVEVFREVRRILKPDGTLWLNLGDTYASAWPCNRRNVIGTGSLENGKRENRPPRLGPGLKEKDLIGIPWMVAFALRADGWYLRQDIIWHKPNPMPESVRDRCTKAHEYIFLLTKSERYYFDNEALREDAVTKASGATWKERKAAGAVRGNVAKAGNIGAGTQRSVFGDGMSHNLGAADGKRNKRSVWTVTTKPFKGAHFATYPADLIEPCVLAGSRPNDVVFDPFGGSGTTAAVALRHGRRAITCELNPEYVELIKQRTAAAIAEYEDL